MFVKPAAGRAKSPVIQLFEEPDDLAKLDAYRGNFPDAVTAPAAPMARPSEKLTYNKKTLDLEVQFGLSMRSTEHSSLNLKN